MTIPNTAATDDYAPHAPNTRHNSRPKSVGVVRNGTSEGDEGRHAMAIERHARSLGLHHIYTVRPPQDHADPIGYALGIAAELQAQVIVVHDLSAVDHFPARVCKVFDLETVAPPESWARSDSRAPRSGTRPDATRISPAERDTGEVRQTEHDGAEALWRPTHDRAKSIAIISARNTSGDGFAVRFAPGTDLVAAREQHPAWNRLWDKISDEFWTEFCPNWFGHHDHTEGGKTG